MVYVSIPDGSLVRAAADGSQRFELAPSSLGAGSPHWSPDGKQIAFTGATPGKQDRIYVVPFDGGVLRQVTNGESGQYGDWDPSWSPDGASLAFGATDHDTAVGESIHVLDLKTKHVRALPGSGGMWSPRWSPDGRFIVGLSANPTNRLMLYDLRTQKQSQLGEVSSGWPSWSRDGEFLFFDSRGVRRIRIRDRKVELVTNWDMRLAGAGWFGTTPDGSLITAHDVGTDEIYASIGNCRKRGERRLPAYSQSHRTNRVSCAYRRGRKGGTAPCAPDTVLFMRQAYSKEGLVSPRLLFCWKESGGVLESGRDSAE